MSKFMKFAYWFEGNKAWIFLWFLSVQIWSHFDHSKQVTATVLFFVWIIPMIIVSLFFKPKMETLKRLEELWQKYPSGSLWHEGYMFETMTELMRRTINLPKYIKEESHIDTAIGLLLQDKTYMFFFKNEEVPIEE